MTGLLAEILLEVFAFLPPDRHGTLCRVSKKWKEASVITFWRVLTWRRTGEYSFLLSTPPPFRTVYHLYGDFCFTLVRDTQIFTSEAQVTVAKRRLRPSLDRNGEPPTPLGQPLLSLQKSSFCYMRDDLLLVISTDLIEAYSLETGELLQKLRPTPQQQEKGVKFTNVLCSGAGDDKRIICKMRPGENDPLSAAVNMYSLRTGACTVWNCGLKKVRSCQASERYIVMKGVAGDKSEVVAIHMDSGAQQSNAHEVFTPTKVDTENFAVKDLCLIGVDKQETAYFVHPRSSKVIPDAWQRWSSRLLRRRQSYTADCVAHGDFEFVCWDIITNDVSRCSLAVEAMPAPYGWPASRPFALILERDKCLLADGQSVLVCFFSRSAVPLPAVHPPGLHGVVVVYTKTGKMLSIIDPTVPSIRRTVFADFLPNLSNTDKSEDEEESLEPWVMTSEMKVDVLSAHKTKPSILMSLKLPSREDGGAPLTRIVAQSYEPHKPLAPTGLL